MKITFDPRFWWHYPIPERLYFGWRLQTWKWLCWVLEIES